MNTSDIQDTDDISGRGVREKVTQADKQSHKKTVPIRISRSSVSQPVPS